jgi:hypothetical protein
MKSHKVLTGLGAFVVLGVVGNLLPDDPSKPNRPAALASSPTPSASPSPLPVIETTAAAPLPTATMTTAQVVATPSPTPTPRVVATSPAAAPVRRTASPKPSPRPVVTSARPVATQPPAQKTYANCAAMNAEHPHGVGRPGAVDHTSGTPVTNFEVNKALYEANTARDKDKDGIACEKA